MKKGGPKTAPTLRHRLHRRDGREAAGRPRDRQWL